jgi:hypothetical protein
MFTPMTRPTDHEAAAAASGLRVDLVTGSSAVTSWQFSSACPKEKISVGAAPQCHWWVRGDGVAPIHLELAWDGVTLWVGPHSPGTRIDGREVNGWTPIQHGNAVMFGNAALNVTDMADEPARAAVPPVVAPASAPSVADPMAMTLATPAPVAHVPSFELSLEGDGATMAITADEMRSLAALHQTAHTGDHGANTTGSRSNAGAHPAAAAARTISAPPSVIHEPEASEPEHLEELFAIPRAPAAPKPNVARRPGLIRRVCWSVSGRAVLLLSAIAGLAFLVWFPETHTAAGRRKSDAAPAAAPPVEPVVVAPPLPPIDLPGVQELDQRPRPFYTDRAITGAERRAADHLAAGRWEKALTEYRELAITAPDDTTYAAVVRILEHKLAKSCQGRPGEPCAPN